MAHYIDNDRLYASVKLYVDAYKEAEEKETQKPRIPEYIGEAILKIAEGLGSRPNFSGYSYKDEMIMDGVMDCLKYIHNYNYEKYPKPFSYINRIIWQAFVRRIDKEKKQQYIKYKSMYRDINLVLPMDIEKDIRNKIEAFEGKKKKD